MGVTNARGAVMARPGTKGIFVSYRREEAGHVAGRLADRLAKRFGTSNVFIDVDSIEPGIDFADAIQHAIDRCDVLLALIGSQWATVVDETGHRRLDNPDDYIVLELKAALARDLRVIPVLVDGANVPPQEFCPPHCGPWPAATPSGLIMRLSARCSLARATLGGVAFRRWKWGRCR